MMSCNHSTPGNTAHTSTLPRSYRRRAMFSVWCAGLAAIKITSPMLLLHKLVGGAEERRVSCGIEARKEIPFYVQNTI